MELLRSLPASLSSLVILISTAVPFVSAATLTDDSKCGCYVTNGTEVAYFTTHKFFDFRNLSRYEGVPDLINNVNDSADASATSSYFTSSDWTDNWQIQSWNNSGSARNDASVYMQNSLNNIYIESNTDANPASQTWLTLRTARLAAFQTAAEMESTVSNFQFLSMRMLARTVGGSGACTAMFTYRESDSLALVQEADLEIRTQDPANVIQYTNQPSYTASGDSIDAATQNATMPKGTEWTDWVVHRLDWTPNQSTWYVDGVEVSSISFQAPRDASHIILNSWSDGGQWTGNMTVNDAAYMQIQWFEMIYNQSSGTSSSTGRVGRGKVNGRDLSTAGCKSVCSVDQTSVQGQPSLLWSNGAQRLHASPALPAWAPSLLALGILAWSSGFLS